MGVATTSHCYPPRGLLNIWTKGNTGKAHNAVRQTLHPVTSRWWRLCPHGETPQSSHFRQTLNAGGWGPREWHRCPGSCQHHGGWTGGGPAFQTHVSLVESAEDSHRVLSPQFGHRHGFTSQIWIYTKKRRLSGCMSQQQAGRMPVLVSWLSCFQWCGLGQSPSLLTLWFLHLWSRGNSSHGSLGDQTNGTQGDFMPKFSETAGQHC